jgi:hypothetical protein
MATRYTPNVCEVTTSASPTAIPSEEPSTYGLRRPEWSESRPPTIEPTTVAVTITRMYPEAAEELLDAVRLGSAGARRAVAVLDEDGEETDGGQADQPRHEEREEE